MLIEILSSALLTNLEAARADGSMNHDRLLALKATQARKGKPSLQRAEGWRKGTVSIGGLILRRYFEAIARARSRMSQMSNSEREERKQEGGRTWEQYRGKGRQETVRESCRLKGRAQKPIEERCCVTLQLARRHSPFSSFFPFPFDSPKIYDVCWKISIPREWNSYLAPRYRPLSENSSAPWLFFYNDFVFLLFFFLSISGFAVFSTGWSRPDSSALENPVNFAFDRILGSRFSIFARIGRRSGLPCRERRDEIKVVMTRHELFMS